MLEGAAKGEFCTTPLRSIIACRTETPTGMWCALKLINHFFLF